MRKIFFLSLIIFCCLSCKKNDIENIELGCVHEFDTKGLNLYTFTPFTDEQWKTSDYSEKMSQRQIPDEFLNKMTTNELFIQFIHMDMAKEVLVAITQQRGFTRAISRYNVLSALYRRTDVADYFIHMLNKIEIDKIQDDECRFYYYCLQMLSAQKELVNKMDNIQTKKYIDTVYKNMEDMTRLSETDVNWEAMSNYTFCLIAFANIMIKYEYIPFINSSLSL